jgi:organic hydroperoxide reductase OsmC/OhrA
LHWKEGPTGTLSAAPRPPIVVGKPPQFDGSDAWWSPEHLLLASAASCLMATYLMLAERHRVKVRGYRCDASGELDRTPEGFRFVSVRLAVSVEAAAGEQSKAEQLLETAKKHCLIANSLKAAITLEIRSKAAAGP